MDYTLCPSCGDGYVNFYRLSNGDFILLCKECEQVWNKHDIPSKYNSLTLDDLRELFLGYDLGILFMHDDAGWATVNDLVNIKRINKRKFELDNEIPHDRKVKLYQTIKLSSTN